MKKIALFIISMLASASVLAGSANLSWTNATQNVDGSTIPATGAGSLLSTRVEYGNCSAPNVFGTKVGEIVVAEPATSVTVNALVPQVYCFRAYHKNTFLQDSDASNVAVRTIDPPKPLPPSTLTVGALTAYSVIKRPDRFVMLPVGTVPAGTKCDPAQSVNGFYAVPRDAVTWAGSVQPDIVVAQCS